MTSDLYCIFNPGPLSIPAWLLNRPPWQNKIYLALPSAYLTLQKRKHKQGNLGRLAFVPSIRVEILGVNIQCCSFSKRKMGRSEICIGINWKVQKEKKKCID